jgi:hypothetical protein
MSQMSRKSKSYINYDQCVVTSLGHVIRMNETRSVTKILEGKLEGRRGKERPRLRCGGRFKEAWCETVENKSIG